MMIFRVQVATENETRNPYRNVQMHNADMMPQMPDDNGANENISKLFQGPNPGQAPVHTAERAGRNDPCPCGSGKKYKKCCMREDE